MPLHLVQVLSTSNSRWWTWLSKHCQPHLTKTKPWTHWWATQRQNERVMTETWATLSTRSTERGPMSSPIQMQASLTKEQLLLVITWQAHLYQSIQAWCWIVKRQVNTNSRAEETTKLLHPRTKTSTKSESEESKTCSIATTSIKSLDLIAVREISTRSHMPIRRLRLLTKLVKLRSHHPWCKTCKL